MAQPETVQEKLDILTISQALTPVFPKINRLCSCCGAIQLSEKYPTKKKVFEPIFGKNYTPGNRFSFRVYGVDEEDIVPPLDSECLIIPDLQGNLTIEWEDV